MGASNCHFGIRNPRLMRVRPMARPVEIQALIVTRLVPVMCAASSVETMSPASSRVWRIAMLPDIKALVWAMETNSLEGADLLRARTLVRESVEIKCGADFIVALGSRKIPGVDFCCVKERSSSVEERHPRRRNLFRNHKGAGQLAELTQCLREPVRCLCKRTCELLLNRRAVAREGFEVMVKGVLSNIIKRVPRDAPEISNHDDFVDRCHVMLSKFVKFELYDNRVTDSTVAPRSDWHHRLPHECIRRADLLHASAAARSWTSADS